MTALVIKNLPNDVLVRLKERAKANHRSLTKEAIVLLSNGVGQASLPGHPRIESVDVAPDGREALRAALVKQPDGSYINVLGIDDESFFETLDRVRSEIRLPDAPDFGDVNP